MKIDRKTILEKYSGKCAYCGNDITLKNFQIDHIVSKKRAYQEPDKDNNRIENLNPACRKCNNFKTSFTLEELRKELSKQVTRLLKNPQFQRALRFDQISIHETPIRFYFERIQSDGK